MSSLIKFSIFYLVIFRFCRPRLGALLHRVVGVGLLYLGFSVVEGILRVNSVRSVSIKWLIFIFQNSFSREVTFHPNHISFMNENVMSSLPQFSAQYGSVSSAQRFFILISARFQQFQDTDMVLLLFKLLKANLSFSQEQGSSSRLLCDIVLAVTDSCIVWWISFVLVVH